MIEAIDVLFYLASYVCLFVSIFWVTTFIFSKRSVTKPPKKYPSLSIIIPAYNAEQSIEKCIRSLENQDYTKLKILVVDDGSTDKTGSIVRNLLKRYKNIRYIKKENGGKASALNVGLRYVRTALFGFIDSDTRLSENTLKNIVSYIRGRFACVTIVLKPEKSNNMIEKIQKVEYALSSFTRRLMSYLNSLYYTPGFSIYKTSIIKKLGGFDENNITEDLEIGLRLKDNGYEIENSTEHFAYTVVPETFRDLFRQRMRWYRGFIYNTRKYSHMFFNKRFGELGILILPLQYLLLAVTTPLLLYGIYKILLTVFQRIIDISMVGPDISYFLSTSSFNMITPTTFFIAVVLVAFLIMLKLSQLKVREEISKLDYIIYIIIYPFISWVIWTSAFIYEIIGVKKKW